MRTMLVALAALAFSSCASSKNGAAAEAELYGKEWKLTELNGKPVNATAERIPTIKFEKEGGRVSGYAGCNRMMGTFTVNGATLKFSPLAATKMACMGDNVETEYLSALAKVNAFGVDAGMLQLQEGEAIIAKFK
ncbi:META domain-containing protein [Chitinophaga sedimenti]|uniref:META domain-containing protein n=1 Tax=Chitinophaga sedimenti TaxID=2033606 RepID=UPI002002FA05|nr:META domain-containing protein [Chitinophaga sedimenti]MCK7555321.1 META domain-containing protein [Chitinophaga sedimenti]